MTAELIRSGLDLFLIILVAIGIVQATRLIGHLSGLRASRGEMERFVQEFTATVARAEAGIKGLKTAARESGDDLEKLVEKSCLVRDELQFIVESADQIAERLMQTASGAARGNALGPGAAPPKNEDTAVSQAPQTQKAEQFLNADRETRRPLGVSVPPFVSGARQQEISAEVGPKAVLPPARSPNLESKVELDRSDPRVAKAQIPRPENEGKPASRAEKDLIQALQKLN